MITKVRTIRCACVRVIRMNRKTIINTLYNQIQSYKINKKMCFMNKIVWLL